MKSLPLLAAAAALVAASCSGASHVSSASSAGQRAAPDAVAAGGADKLVSYHGVQIRVPATWPVVGGHLTPTCDGPWPTSPKVFIGDQPSAGLSCLGPGPRGRGDAPGEHLDGVWLRPYAAGDTGLIPLILPSGQHVEEFPPSSDGQGTDVVFHQTWLLVGSATPPEVTAAVLASLSYQPGAPDSAVVSACKTQPVPTPPAIRLDRQLVLDRGNIVLDPPASTDRPAVPSTVATAGPETQQSIDGAQLYLARFSSKLPALAEPDGSLRPLNHDVLAWVLYSFPLSPDVSNCGGWGVDAYNATTGAVILNSGWSPGP